MLKVPTRTYSSIAAYFKANPDQTLTEHARALGMRVNDLCRFKLRTRYPSVATAIRLADHFNVPLDSLAKPSREPERKAG